MREEELDVKSFQTIFREVLSGKSFREIEKEYGINREIVSKKCKELFPEGSEEAQKVEQIIEYNKKKSAEKSVSDEKLEEVCKKVFQEEMNKEEACSVLGLDILTLNEKITHYISNCNDSKLKKEYIQYEAKRHPDYSHINFKALLIEMARSTSSQMEMAKQYGIPVRTIGREIEKIKEDEYYADLYDMCKECADRNMHRQGFSSFEKDLIGRVLSKYEEGNIIKENIISKEEAEYKRAKDIVQLAESCRGSNVEKAKTAGVSVSTLRRMKIFIEKYEKKQEMKEEIGREDV